MVRTNYVKVNKEAIREQLVRKKISAPTMSKIIGKANGFLTKLISPNGNGVTHISNVEKIADTFGCAMDKLVESYDDTTGDKNLVYVVDKLRDAGLTDTEIATQLGYKNTIALRKEYNKGKHILYIERKRVDDGLKHVGLTSEDLEDDEDENIELDKEYRKSRREAGSKLDMTVWDLLSGYDAILEQIAVMINGDESMYYVEKLPDDILDSFVENWKVLREFNVLGISVEVPKGYLLLKITLKEDK